MAGHVRSIDTGKARRTASGKTRKIRQHLPPGEVEKAKRRKQHLGARTVINARLAATSDPLRRLDIAREYVRSAAAKYQVSGELAAAVDALIAAGDRIFITGEPLSPSAKRTRRAAAEQHRAKRKRTALLVREGRAAVRRQQNDTRHSA